MPFDTNWNSYSVSPELETFRNGLVFVFLVHFIVVEKAVRNLEIGTYIQQFQPLSLSVRAHVRVSITPEAGRRTYVMSI